MSGETKARAWKERAGNGHGEAWRGQAMGMERQAGPPEDAQGVGFSNGESRTSSSSKGPVLERRGKDSCVFQALLAG